MASSSGRSAATACPTAPTPSRTPPVRSGTEQQSGVGDSEEGRPDAYHDGGPPGGWLPRPRAIILPRACGADRRGGRPPPQRETRHERTTTGPFRPPAGPPDLVACHGTGPGCAESTWNPARSRTATGRHGGSRVEARLASIPLERRRRLPPHDGHGTRRGQHQRDRRRGADPLGRPALGRRLRRPRPWLGRRPLRGPGGHGLPPPPRVRHRHLRQPDGPLGDQPGGHRPLLSRCRLYVSLCDCQTWDTRNLNRRE